MKRIRLWLVLVLAVGGCSAPIGYWSGVYFEDLYSNFPFLRPAKTKYQLPPGYDPNPPVPRTRPPVKAPVPAAESDPASSDALPATSEALSAVPGNPGASS